MEKNHFVSFIIVLLALSIVIFRVAEAGEYVGGGSLLGCECSAAQGIDASLDFYSKVLQQSDVAFVGKLIDKIYITPSDFIAVFEEYRLFKGEVSKIKLFDESEDAMRPVRYVLSSDLASACLYQFKGIYLPYVVFGKKKSASGNLFSAGRCDGSTVHSQALESAIANALAKKKTN